MKTPTKKFLATIIPQTVFFLTLPTYSAIPNLILAALFIQWCMVDSRQARMARDQRVQHVLQ